MRRDRGLEIFAIGVSAREEASLDTSKLEDGLLVTLRRARPDQRRAALFVARHESPMKQHASGPELTFRIALRRALAEPEERPLLALPVDLRGKSILRHGVTELRGLTKVRERELRIPFGALARRMRVVEREERSRVRRFVCHAST